MSAGNETGDRARRFQEFHARHGRKAFTPDFNSSLEALMQDRGATVCERVLAWAKRYAWGNYSDFAVDDEGRPLGQVDCAEQLRIDKRQVNTAVRVWEARGYLRTEGRLIYPDDSPQPERRGKVIDPYDFRSPSFRLFLQDWSHEHPDEYRLLEEARALVERLRMQIVEQYRERKKSLALSTNGSGSRSGAGQKVARVEDEKSLGSRTNEPPILIDEKEEVLNSGESYSSSSLSEAAEPTTTTPSDEAQVAEALSRYAACDDDAVRQLIDACRRHAPDATCEEVIAFVHAKGPLAIRRPSPLGFLLTAVPRCFIGESFRLFRAQQAKMSDQESRAIHWTSDWSIEKQICAAEEWLSEMSPDHENRPAALRLLAELRETAAAGPNGAGKGMR